MKAELLRRATPPAHVDAVTRQVHNRILFARAPAPAGDRNTPPAIPPRRHDSGRPAARRAAGQRSGQDPGGEPEPGSPARSLRPVQLRLPGLEGWR
jgi:hypothetical protein